MSPLGGARGALGAVPLYPEFVDSATFKNGGGSAATNVTQPADTEVGDYVLVFAFGDSGSPATAWPTPAGWTKLGDASLSTTPPFALFGRVATVAGAGAASSFAGHTPETAFIATTYRYVDTNAPIGDFATFRSPSHLTDVVAPSITPTRLGLLITAHSMWNSTTSRTPVTPPSGMTEREEYWGTAGWPTSVINEEKLTHWAATGTRTAVFTTSGSAVAPVAASFVLRRGLTTVSELTFRSAHYENTDSGTSLEVPAPAGTSADDRLLLFATTEGSPGSVDTLTTPTGWTLERTDLSTEGRLRGYVFSRIATGVPNDDKAVLVTPTASQIQGHILAYHGSIASDFVGETEVDLDAFESGGAVYRVEAPSLTPTRTGRLVTCHFASASGTGSALVPPTGMTERSRHGSGGAIRALVADQARTDLTATGVRQATGFSSASDDGLGYSVMVVPGTVPAFVSASSAGDGSQGTVDAPKPAGMANGNVLLAIVMSMGTLDHLAEAGWTQEHEEQVAGGGVAMKLSLYSRVVDGTEPGSITFDTNLATSHGLVMLAYSGVRTSDPIGTLLVSATAASASADVDAPSIVPDEIGRLVTVHMKGNTVAEATIAPSGMTKRQGLAYSTALHMSAADVALTSLAATGVKTASGFSTGSASRWGLSFILHGE